MRQHWRKDFPAPAGTALGFLLIVAATAAAHAQAPEEQDSREPGCILESFELEADAGDTVQLGDTVLLLETAGTPTSLGARIEPGDRVALDLAGCLAGPAISDRTYADGLVSAIELARRGGPGSVTVVVKIRGPFEYSVSSSPGSIRLRLRSQAQRPPSLVRVLEPLSAIRPQTPLEPLEPLPPPVDRVAPPPAEPEAAVLRATLEAWARAWSDQRVADYLSAYASDFRPPGGLSRDDWQQGRRQRLTVPSFIEVSFDRLQTRIIAPGRASTTFWQSYRSDAFSDQVFKELIWTRENGSWKILEERTDLTVEPEVAAAPEVSGASGGRTGSNVPPGPGPPTITELLAGARLSVRRAPRYDATYRVLAYPGGDPGWQRGSSVDLVLRAYRELGVDLQKRIHEDILAAPEAYGILQPDANIDHRRLRVLGIFFRRHGRQLGTERVSQWQPGDIVLWSLESDRANHVGIVSDRLSPSGHPQVIHHAADQLPREEDMLFAWPIQAHYRWLP